MCWLLFEGKTFIISSLDVKETGESFPFFRVSVGTLTIFCRHVCSLPTLAHYCITSSVDCRREQTVTLCGVAVFV